MAKTKDLNARLLKDKLEDIARRSGWNQLGEFDVETEVALNNEEKIELGKFQSQTIMKIDQIEDQIRDFSKERKEEVRQLEGIVRESASTLKRGTRIVNRMLPAFYDPKENCRLFIDPETGEVVKKMEAEYQDRQGTLSGTI